MKEITWVLVMDGARAQLYQHIPPNRDLFKLQEEDFSADHRPAREILADKPGRTFDAKGLGRHAKEPQSDPHETLKRRFVHDMALLLDKKEQEYDRLVLIAPPRTLGSLRKELTTAVSRKTIVEINKDLTQASGQEVARYLQFIINPPLKTMIQTG